MILDEKIIERYKNDPEGLAEFSFQSFFANKIVSYPVNPFEVLETLGIPFVFRNFKSLEGLVLADKEKGDMLVAINAKRPVQRQRYSCAHELCHIIKDVGHYDPFSCITGSRSRIERYAEHFASCFLMPRKEVVVKIKEKLSDKYLSFDDVLNIAEYFGVSFKACLLRISECMPSVLRRDFREKSEKYKPALRRKAWGFSDAALYNQIIDTWSMMWSEPSNQSAKYAFDNDFIYNDSRLEGLAIEKSEVAEIIADIRTGKKNKSFRNSSVEEVAGHSSLYDKVFGECQCSKIDIYMLINMNRILFSYVPYSEFGGRTRTQNTYVIGAKFETADYKEVMPELQKLNAKVIELENENEKLRKSEILYRILEIHHELTKIHPFPDGNGRTARAFMNLQLLRYGFPPVYILLEDKSMYLKALSDADSNGKVDSLYGLVVERIIKSHADFFSIGR